MLKLYNRLSSKFEEFRQHPNNINIFVCGPTLYDDIHLGHLRVLFLTDLIIRYFKFRKLKTKLIINLTDMDLKISERAEKEKKDVKSLIDQYYERVVYDIKEIIAGEINFIRPSNLINESSKIIEYLLDKNLAYKTSSGIYCDISRSNHLGELSKKERSAILQTILEPEENKRNPCDFKLWTNSGYEYCMNFGKGMVGWHLQDYTVIHKMFEDSCDIHVGAKELIFPHHEFILLLGEYYSNKFPISRYFVHTGLLKYKGDKMSKSLGNVIYYKEIKGKYNIDALRLYYFFLNRNKDYSFNVNRLNYYNKLLKKFKLNINKGKKGYNLERKILEYRERFIKSIENNLDTNRALTTWLELNKYLENRSIDENSIETLRDTYKIFSQLTGILENFTIE